tara:strand:- start:1974 stop:2216 length:243 start_codon:yes stop_codon:yes gene_type:complete
MTLWTDHIKKVAAKNKITYKAAMTVAASSWTKGKTAKIAKKMAPKPKQTKKDKMDESKGMTGQTKGKSSKTKEDFTTTES